MITSINRHRTAKLFESRRGHLDERVKRDYIRNGVVSIPCRISDYNEVISSYSVKGLETLNPDFVDYVKEVAEVTPDDLPIVLNVVGDKLTQTEQKTIEETILDDFAYDLGMVEKEERRHTWIFRLMIVVLVVMGIALELVGEEVGVPREFLYIVFWFAGDTLVDYVFLTGYDLRQDRKLAGRLASMKVVFSEAYEDTAYTQDDVERLHAEMEEDVRGTIPKGY